MCSAFLLVSEPRANTLGGTVGAKGIRTLGLEIGRHGDAPGRAFLAVLLPMFVADLERAGVTALVSGDKRFGDAEAKVTVLLKAYKSPDGSQCAWGVDIELRQPVRLERSPQDRLSAWTYHNWRMGITECASLETVLREEAAEFFGQFANIIESENRQLRR
jgi:hypothetical protein